MVVGILQFELFVHDAESLKDKRRVVSSVKDRLHREHMVSVAEVGNTELLNHATLALALVGNDGKHIAGVLDRITAKLRGLHDAELGDTFREILHGQQLLLKMDDQDAEGAVIDESLARELLERASSLEVADESVVKKEGNS